VTTSETLNVNGAIASLSTNRTRVGWTVGAGVEAALWSNWTAKLEYLYIDFGTINNTLIGIAPITPIVTSSHVNDQILRVGLNYRFGQAVVARY
jgi:outer membrane immunogenic protein